MEWQPIETAPRDGRYILAIASDIDERYNQPGRMFVIRHEGRTPSDFDLGWAVYPGFGGAPDRWFTHWLPLPEPPQP